MYVQEGSLTYLCCRCCKQRFDLSHIEEIEVIYNQTIYPNRGNSSPIVLSPGLKLTISPNTVVLVAMPDAVNFAKLLARSSGNQELEGVSAIKEERTGTVVYSKII